MPLSQTVFAPLCVLTLTFACGTCIAGEAGPQNTVLRGGAVALPTFSDPVSGIIIVCPGGWVFMTPESVRSRTRSELQVSANTLVFCVNEKDPDQNINVRYTGDALGEAPDKAAAKRFLSSMEQSVISNFSNNFSEFSPRMSRISPMADGYALDLTFSSRRGDAIMVTRSILLIANGRAFAITCTAPEGSFANTNAAIFDEFVSQIVVEP